MSLGFRVIEVISPHLGGCSCGKRALYAQVPLIVNKLLVDRPWMGLSASPDDDDAIIRTWEAIDKSSPIFIVCRNAKK